ncbi:MAG: serine hydrolase, partial [Gemmatimonadaceae bacterium]
SDRSSAGRYFSPRSFGHTGFTGTSIWIDPERGVFVVLLTNRVNPTRANLRHEALRRAIADAVQSAIVDAPLSQWRPE